MQNGNVKVALQWIVNETVFQLTLQRLLFLLIREEILQQDSLMGAYKRQYNILRPVVSIMLQQDQKFKFQI